MRLDSYQLTQALVEGPTGGVYLGVAPTGIKVVVKTVPDGSDAALMLADEARAGLRARHAAIVETVDYFVENGQAILVVALIEGPTLLDLRRQYGPLPSPALAELGRQIAGALDVIHAAVDDRGRPLRMIHRDVTPGNVLVDRTGQARLIDLGIVHARDRLQQATAQTVVKGALRYLAPEIMLDAEPSPSMDLWALGITLWEAAIGKYAVDGDDTLAMRHALDGRLYEALRKAPIDAELLDVLTALVAPTGSRLLSARATLNVFENICRHLLGGREQLAQLAAPLAPHETDGGGRPAAELVGLSDLDDLHDETGDFAGPPDTEAGVFAGGDDTDPRTEPMRTAPPLDAILAARAAPTSPGYELDPRTEPSRMAPSVDAIMSTGTSTSATGAAGSARTTVSADADTVIRAAPKIISGLQSVPASSSPPPVVDDDGDGAAPDGRHGDDAPTIVTTAYTGEHERED